MLRKHIMPELNIPFYAVDVKTWMSAYNALVENFFGTLKAEGSYRGESCIRGVTQYVQFYKYERIP